MFNLIAPRYVLAVGAAVLALIFGVSTSRALTPPELVVVTPENGAVALEPVTTLSGSAPGAQTIMVNGTVLPQTATPGAFDALIPLSPGTNLLRVSAKKRHSRPAVIERRVIYESTAPDRGVDR